MTYVEILALIQSARALLDLGLSQYHLATQEGRLTEQQKLSILQAAQLSDAQVDQIIQEAKQRLNRSRN